MPVLKIKKNGSWVEVWGALGNGSENGSAVNAPKLTTITLLSDLWIGDISPYYQSVSISGVNVNSKLDLQPTPEQLSALQDAEISLMAVNDQGSVKVYSLNDKPESDMTMQVLITDVTII